MQATQLAYTVSGELPPCPGLSPELNHFTFQPRKQTALVTAARRSPLTNGESHRNFPHGSSHQLSFLARNRKHLNSSNLRHHLPDVCPLPSKITLKEGKVVSQTQGLRKHDGLCLQCAAMPVKDMQISTMSTHEYGHSLENRICKLVVLAFTCNPSTWEGQPG